MKILVVHILFFCISMPLLAQRPKVENLRRFEEKQVHFGFALGINTGQLTLDRKSPMIGDSLLNLDVVNQSGFNLGIVSSLHLNRSFSLRFVPLLVFTQRNLDYQFMGSNGKPYLVQRQIESTYLDFPLLLKYRSFRLNNFAAYLIGGIKYSVDLASNEKVKNEDISELIVKLQRNSTSAEVGIGTDFFLPYFKFSIEMKMSYGLHDVLIHDNTYLSDPIDRILPRMFIFSFLFEG